ncbi:MAG: AMP-binding protein [Jiangellaceae bacterium]
MRCDDQVITYARLDGRSELLAASLLARGLRRGDRVATLTASSPEHVELLFACAKTGLVLLPLNWRLTARELAYQLDNAEPALLFVEPGREAPAEPPVERVEPSRGALDALGDGAGDANDAVVDDADPLLLVYTSGATGRPKGAVLTHANCFWTNLSLDRTLPLGGSDIVLAVLRSSTSAAGTCSRCWPGGSARPSCWRGSSIRRARWR